MGPIEVENKNANQVALTRQIKTAETDLVKELKKERPNFERLFTLVCNIQMMLSRYSGQEARVSIRELSRDLEKDLKAQRGTFGTFKVYSFKWAAAAVQLAGAAAGLGAIATLKESMAVPLSYAGKGISDFGQTFEEGQSSERLKFEHLTAEDKRLRDESSGLKNRLSQEEQELMEKFNQLMSTIHRAKTSILGA